MARGALWATGVSVLAAVLAAGPSPVARAEDDKAPLIRALRMGRGGSHLGVNLADVTGEDRARLKLTDERGALVREVQADTPAAKAGLKADDVVVRFDGEAVRSAAQLSRLVRETPPGRTVAIEVSRGGGIQRLTATLDEQEGRPFGLLRGVEDLHGELAPPVPPAPAMPPMPPIEPLMREGMDAFRRGFFIERPGRLGITYQELSGQLARYFKAEDGSLLVTDVEADSPAGKAGLKAGDVIVQVNGKAVSRGQDLRERVTRAESGAELTLGVQRDGKPLDVKVTLPARARSRTKREPTI